MRSKSRAAWLLGGIVVIMAAVFLFLSAVTPHVQAERLLVALVLFALGVGLVILGGRHAG
ncbi:MAG: hypothetical protein NVSMB42_24700 [Herpetosiphon sp.]